MGIRELVGIDFSTNNLKIAHLKIYPNKKELVNVLSQGLSDLSDDDISKTIQTRLKELKLKKPIVSITIPAHLVITKNIEVPSTNDNEIREIINLQTGRHTPYSREEIIIDYITIGRYRQNYTRILLCNKMLNPKNDVEISRREFSQLKNSKFLITDANG